jgi:hypothetical protein
MWAGIREGKVVEEEETKGMEPYRGDGGKAAHLHQTLLKRGSNI